MTSDKWFPGISYITPTRDSDHQAGADADTVLSIGDPQPAESEKIPEIDQAWAYLSEHGWEALAKNHFPWFVRYRGALKDYLNRKPSTYCQDQCDCACWNTWCGKSTMAEQRLPQAEIYQKPDGGWFPDYNRPDYTNMAEVAPAAAEPAKAPKKKAAPRPKKAGPSVAQLITAVSASKERSGVSLAVLKKALTAGGYDVEKRVKVAVKRLVTKGTLVQLKGTVASGSFKLNKTATVAAKRPEKKAAAPKPKKAVAQKPAAAAKKSPKKAKKPAAPKPKKARKPAAIAKKAAKSPKVKKASLVKKAPAPKKAAKVVKPKVAKPKAKKAAPKK